MKAMWIVVFALGLLVSPARAQQTSAPPSAPTTQKDKVSYVLGVQVAKTLKVQGIEVNADLLIQTDNGKKDGVVTLPSGLQYKIVKTAAGKKPSDADTVTCNYRGTLIDGTEFDKSTEGQPATFQVGAVIPGFKEALKLMPVGSTWQFFIPPNLAYGERGAGNMIGPNSALIFEVELLSIKDQTANP